jgi:hypothetical protein
MQSEVKSSWPVLVGKTGEEAKAVISAEAKNVNVQVLP